MTLPANIRLNVGAPFPSVVKGGPGIGITRKNGIWGISLAYPQLGIQAPPPLANYDSDYVAIYDSIAGVYFLVPLTALALGGQQRSVAAAPVVIQPTDQILNLNLAASTTITLPTYALRNGVPLIFKDVGHQASANPITIAAPTGETIDGLLSVSLDVNGQEIAVRPANDSFNTGWFLGGV